jgi:uncharacterized protein YdeI (YjbR/CyaY-like superfamily)
MKNELDTTHMTRKIHDIPDYVVDALNESRLWESYKSRPPYQQNDYIGWINRARRQETKNKRIEIMLSKLRAGSGYMGLDWVGSRTKG